MWSRQKLGMILENKMSKNRSYQKMSNVKVTHLNLYFYMQIYLRTKIQMIIVIVIVSCLFVQNNAKGIMHLSEIINSRINKSFFEIGEKSHQNVPLCD